MAQMISYNLHGCLYPEKPADLQNWFDILIRLTAEEMSEYAKAYKFNPKSVQKLITIKSKKFRYIKKKGYEITKTFHDTPIEYMRASDARQPVLIRSKKIIEETNATN